MSSTQELPSVAEIFGPVLERVSPEQQPLLIAIAERMAAERYRRWANTCSDPMRQSQLLGCAAREEEIARRVEGLYPDATAIQRDILAKNPDLEDLNRSVFADRPLDDQYTIQAQGERVGAATWRSLAKREQSSSGHQTFLACAELEEQSALVLEAILRGDG